MSRHELSVKVLRVRHICTSHVVNFVALGTPLVKLISPLDTGKFLSLWIDNNQIDTVLLSTENFLMMQSYTVNIILIGNLHGSLH